jgi:transcriptional regulator with XRE-family HTH domain
METFGQRLKAERERIGLTQADFAEACGVGKTAQYTYERGEREPGVSYLEAAAALGADILYISTGRRDPTTDGRMKAYGRILLTIERLLGLDGARLDALLEIAFDDDAKIGSAKRVKFDPERISNAVREWLGAATMPDELLDLELLATIIQQVDAAKQKHPNLAANKQARAIATLYRASKASGKIDSALISSTVALAAE